MENQFQPNMKEQKLTEISELLKKSFQLFKEKLGTILAITGVLGGITVILVFFFITTGIYLLSKPPYYPSPPLFLLTLIFVLLLFFLELVIEGSLISVLGENKAFFQAINTALKKLLPLFLTRLLTIIAIFFGTLFFILPGIIFTVWFSFGNFAVVLDGKRGIQALIFSKNLVSGKWGEVFKRLLFLLFLWMILTRIGAKWLPSGVSLLLQLFLFSFSVIYLFLIYSELKKIKGA